MADDDQVAERMRRYKEEARRALEDRKRLEALQKFIKDNPKGK